VARRQGSRRACTHAAFLGYGYRTLRITGYSAQKKMTQKTAYCFLAGNKPLFVNQGPLLWCKHSAKSKKTLITHVEAVAADCLCCSHALALPA
jgi:hypothetical protein